MASLYRRALQAQTLAAGVTLPTQAEIDARVNTVKASIDAASVQEKYLLEVPFLPTENRLMMDVADALSVAGLDVDVYPLAIIARWWP